MRIRASGTFNEKYQSLRIFLSELNFKFSGSETALRLDSRYFRLLRVSEKESGRFDKAAGLVDYFYVKFVRSVGEAYFFLAWCNCWVVFFVKGIVSTTK